MALAATTNVDQSDNRRVAALSKTDWGTKHICHNCGTRYYDLNKVPVVCPKCSAEFDPEAFLKSRRTRSAAVEELPAKPKPEKAKKVADQSDQGEEDADDEVEEDADVAEDEAADADDEIEEEADDEVEEVDEVVEKDEPVETTDDDSDDEVDPALDVDDEDGLLEDDDVDDDEIDDDLDDDLDDVDIVKDKGATDG